MSALRPRYGVLVVLAMLFPLAAAATSAPVLAQYACTGQVSYPTMSALQYSSSVYYGSNNYYGSNGVAMTMNVSVNCPLTGQVSAVGYAHDSSTNTDLGSTNAILTEINGGYFNGQLVFYLPPSVQGHTLTITVSIYNNNGVYGYAYNGQRLGTATITINVGYYYQSSYPNSYSNYYDQVYYNSHYTCYYYPPTYYNVNHSRSYHYMYYNGYHYYQTCNYGH